MDLFYILHFNYSTHKKAPKENLRSLKFTT